MKDSFSNNSDNKNNDSKSNNSNSTDDDDNKVLVMIVVIKNINYVLITQAFKTSLLQLWFNRVAVFKFSSKKWNALSR